MFQAIHSRILATVQEDETILHTPRASSSCIKQIGFGDNEHTIGNEDIIISISLGMNLHPTTIGEVYLMTNDIMK